MNSFEFNKIFASLLTALLVAMIVHLFSDELISPEKLHKNIYLIDVPKEVPGEGVTPKKETLQPITPLLLKADVTRGEKLTEKLCGQCHTFKQGEHNKTGPNLFGIVGGQFAHLANFAYSKIFQEKHSAEKWDEEKLNQYLYSPRAMMKGTKMAFAGIRKDDERADVILFLKSLK